MKIFILSAHNKPSGGTKVLNQVVNLCTEKKIDSYFVYPTDKAERASFLSNPASVMSLKDFDKVCQPDDIIINCWQQRDLHKSVKNAPSQTKVFWSHGASIPVYPDFNGEEVFTSKVYNQHWNVSHACADYLQTKYNLPKVDIVHPFFDDETLLSYKKTSKDSQRNGILLVRRRGQAIIPSIVRNFPNQKITIMPDVFTDEELYKELPAHTYFVSYDNGVGNAKLIPSSSESRWSKLERNLNRYYRKLITKPNVNQPYNTWLIPEGHLLGFPVTACEAAWLGTVVIGFAMGGGLEWMTDSNMYKAKDGDADSLLEKIKEAVKAPEKELREKQSEAYKAVSVFNKEHTWNQISTLLRL